MAISVKNSGSWVVPSKIHVKDDGTWKQATQVYVKQGGFWYPQFNALTISTNQVDYDLFVELGSPTTPISAAITIESSATISASSTSVPAFKIDGFASGSVIYLTNNGVIIGAGGAGGDRVSGTSGAANPGQPGGTAIYTRNTLKLTNTHTVASGGGGGGSGRRVNRTGDGEYSYTGPGGGGAGITNGVGGTGITNPDRYIDCAATSDGNNSLGGAGLAWCGSLATTVTQSPSTGGAGGNLGQAGARGTPNPDFDGTNLGGRAGYAIDGISYTTKVAAGTILGTEIN